MGIYFLTASVEIFLRIAKNSNVIKTLHLDTLLEWCLHLVWKCVFFILKYLQDIQLKSINLMQDL